MTAGAPAWQMFGLRHSAGKLEIVGTRLLSPSLASIPNGGEGARRAGEEATYTKRGVPSDLPPQSKRYAVGFSFLPAFVARNR